MALRRAPNRWPAPPLVAPRGLREWAWHTGLALTVTSQFLTPLGVMFLPLTTLVAVYYGLSPRRLLRSLWTLALATLGLVLASDLLRHPVTLASLALLGRTPANLPRWEIDVLFVLLTYLHSWISTALLLAYDRRTVNPDVVDARVLERQRLRRRQLLTHWHASASIDEVVP